MENAKISQQHASKKGKLNKNYGKIWKYYQAAIFLTQKKLKKSMIIVEILTFRPLYPRRKECQNTQKEILIILIKKLQNHHAYN